MAIITLKHLAKEFNIDPYDLRMALRKANLKPNNRRWNWEDTKNEHYKACRKVAQSKSSGKSTSPAAKPSKAQPSAPAQKPAKSSGPKTPSASKTTTTEAS